MTPMLGRGEAVLYLRKTTRGRMQFRTGLLECSIQPTLVPQAGRFFVSHDTIDYCRLPAQISNSLGSNLNITCDNRERGV
jgi:hypothetical protein